MFGTIVASTVGLTLAAIAVNEGVDAYVDHQRLAPRIRQAIAVPAPRLSKSAVAVREKLLDAVPAANRALEVPADLPKAA